MISLVNSLIFQWQNPSNINNHQSFHIPYLQNSFFSSYVDLPRAAAANTPLSTSSPPPSGPCAAALLAARRGVFRPRLGDPTSAATGPGDPEMAGSTMVQRKMMKHGVELAMLILEILEIWRSYGDHMEIIDRLIY